MIWLLCLVLFNCSEKTRENILSQEEREKIRVEKLERAILYDNPARFTFEYNWNEWYRNKRFKRLWNEVLGNKSRNIEISRIKALIEIDTEYINKRDEDGYIVLERCITKIDLNIDKDEKEYLAYLGKILECLIPFTNNFHNETSNIMNRVMKLELNNDLKLKLVKRVVEVDRRVLDTRDNYSNIPLVTALGKDKIDAEILDILISNTNNWNTEIYVKGKRITILDLVLAKETDFVLIGKILKRISEVELEDGSRAIDLVNSEGKTSLMLTMELIRDSLTGDIKNIYPLIDIICNCEAKAKDSSFRILSFAIKENFNTEILIKLIDGLSEAKLEHKGTALDLTDDEGKTALLLALLKAEKANLLFDSGDITEKEKLYAILPLLIDGTSNFVSSNDDTAVLYIAMKYLDKDMFERLINRMIEIKLEDNNTAIDLKNSQNQTVLMLIIEQFDSLVNRKDFSDKLKLLIDNAKDFSAENIGTVAHLAILKCIGREMQKMKDFKRSDGVYEVDVDQFKDERYRAFVTMLVDRMINIKLRDNMRAIDLKGNIDSFEGTVLSCLIYCLVNRVKVDGIDIEKIREDYNQTYEDLLNRLIDNTHGVSHIFQGYKNLRSRFKVYQLENILNIFDFQY